MNPLIQFKKITPLFVVGCVLVCFGFSQQMRALSPAPDGCYPNYTTAEGCDGVAKERVIPNRSVREAVVGGK